MRLYLAFAVYAAHRGLLGFSLIPFSFTAVCCFFIVSGFYMNMVIAEKYGVTRDGLTKFYKNRVLRLYPVYVVVLLLWHLAWLWGASHRTPFTSIFGTLNQLALLPEVIWSHLILRPGPSFDANALFLGQTFTVGMEMVFYLVAPVLVLCRLRYLALVWLAGFIALHVPAWLGLAMRPWQYEFVPTVFVFFVTGCISYRLWLVVQDQVIVRWLALPLALAIPAYCYLIDDLHVAQWVNRPAIYGLYVLVALAIPCFFAATRKSRFDRAIGDLSYPLYVCQGFAVMLVMGPGEPATNAQHAAALVLAFAISAVLAFGVERPIDAWRATLAKRTEKRNEPALVDQEISAINDRAARSRPGLASLG